MAERVFSIIELRRVGSRLVGTGVRFDWDARTQTAPRGSWSFGGHLRTVRTDYPGAREPVEQVLGANYEPFTISGVWDDRYAGEGFARDTWKAFEQLCQRGNLVRIQFADVQIVGLITDWDFDYRLETRVGYTFTVSPHFRHQGETRRVLVRKALPRADELKGRLDEPMAEVAEIHGAAPREQLAGDAYADVDGDVEVLNGTFEEIAKVIDERLSEGEEATQGILRLALLFQSAKTAAAGVISRVRGMRGDLDLAYETAIGTLEFESWTRGLAEQAGQIIGIGHDASEELAERVTPQTQAIHQGRQGQTLMAVSLLYYGTADNWQLVQAANNLDTFVLEGGELLVIPDAPRAGV